jgi:hypothetical protein
VGERTRGRGSTETPDPSADPVLSVRARDHMKWIWAVRASWQRLQEPLTLGGVPFGQGGGHDARTASIDGGKTMPHDFPTRSTEAKTAEDNERRAAAERARLLAFAAMNRGDRISAEVWTQAALTAESGLRA